jgi:hypothetical protein
MPLFEDRSAAFIVRVWCESGETPGAVRAWRGSIEHVASGQRSFFTELDVVIAFMQPHLTQLGITEPLRFWDHMEAAQPAPAMPEERAPAAPKPQRARR